MPLHKGAPPLSDAPLGELSTEETHASLVTPRRNSQKNFRSKGNSCIRNILRSAYCVIRTTYYNLVSIATYFLKFLLKGCRYPLRGYKPLYD